MKNWTYLKPNDIVDIIAPGSAADEKLLMSGTKALESWGLKPRFTAGIVTQENPYLAQTDEFRLKDLKRALLAKDSKAVWCLRGGYGAIRLLPGLAKMKAPLKPKLLIGYSDITSLHIFLNQKWKWTSLHGPLIDRFAEGTMTHSEVQDLKSLIFGATERITYENLIPMNAAAKKKKIVKSRITGGNMVVTQSSLGTPFQYRPDGIVFFEEIAERGYRVDRMLVQMEQAGVFTKAKAVIFADFIGGAEPHTENKFWKLAQEDFAERAKIPVLKGLPAGHAIPNRPVPLGSYAELTLGGGVLGERATLMAISGGKKA